MENVRQRLISLRDEKYRDFTARLIPTVDKEKIIGVRTPAVRALAKELDGDTAAAFLSALPHCFHEENMLHAALIDREKDFLKCIELTDAFLPFIDNWAVCDCFGPAVFKKHKGELIKHIKRWLGSKKTYTVRFGLKTLMTHYLDGDFDPAYLELAAATDTREYYLSMMTAWFFATALAKQYESALPYIEQGRLDTATRNRAIQQADESYRVSAERKEYLKTLKIKETKVRKNA